MSERLDEQHQIVLDLVDSHSQPVLVEELQWATDYGEGSYRFSVLGPRPRRGPLFTILGDLIDDRLITRSDKGMSRIPSQS